MNHLIHHSSNRPHATTHRTRSHQQMQYTQPRRSKIYLNRPCIVQKVQPWHGSTSFRQRGVVLGDGILIRFHDPAPRGFIFGRNDLEEVFVNTSGFSVDSSRAFEGLDLTRVRFIAKTEGVDDVAGIELRSMVVILFYMLLIGLVSIDDEFIEEK